MLPSMKAVVCWRFGMRRFLFPTVPAARPLTSLVYQITRKANPATITMFASRPRRKRLVPMRLGRQPIVRRGAAASMAAVARAVGP